MGSHSGWASERKSKAAASGEWEGAESKIIWGQGSLPCPQDPFTKRKKKWYLLREASRFSSSTSANIPRTSAVPRLPAPSSPAPLSSEPCSLTLPESSKVGLGHRRTNRHRSGPARRTPGRGGGKNRPRAPRKSLPFWPAERRGGIRGPGLAGRRG